MLRRLVLVLFNMMSLPAVAAGFNFIPAHTPAQKDVVQTIQAGDYDKALKNWGPAFAGSAFAESSNGVAVKALLLEKNGMPFTALEFLMRFSQPARLTPEMRQYWTAELKTSPYIQKGWISTLGGWKKIVDNSPLRLKLNSKADIDHAFYREWRLPKEAANEKARFLWQIATRAPLINQTSSSLRALKLLKQSKQNIIGDDLIAMVEGRVLYQRGQLDAALKAFESVPKSSNLWIDAVEERAWTHLRKGDYDQATAVVTTGLSPVMAPLARPETFFLANLLDYRICDFTSLFKNDDLFKQRHRDRMNEIQDLARKGMNATLPQVLARFDQNGVSQFSAGPLVSTVPHGIYRDHDFVADMESRRELLIENQKATEYFSGESVVGAQLDKVLSTNRTAVESLKQRAIARARVLARVDLAEYKSTLNKMNILEGEVIQRLHLDDNLKGQRSKLAKVEDSGDVLVFPYSNEVWMDELDNYKAQVKDCPTLKGASL